MRLVSIPVAVLLMAGVAGALGAATSRTLVSVDEKKWSAPGIQEIPFDLPDAPGGQQVRLSVDIRNEAAAYYGGFAHWLKVSVNGATVLGPDLLNKRFDFFCRRPSRSSTTCTRSRQWRFVPG